MKPSEILYLISTSHVISCEEMAGSIIFIFSRGIYISSYLKIVDGNDSLINLINNKTHK